MQKPSGSNLEILAQLPSFFDELIKENTEMKERLKKLESQKEPDKYDDSELKKSISALKKSVASIKPYDDKSVNDAIASLKKAVNSLKNYDDSEIKRKFALLEKTVSQLKNYDDSELKKQIAAIKPYDDSDLKEQIEDAVRLCKRDDSQYRSLVEQLDIVKQECFKACKESELSDRITFIENVLGVK